MNNFERLEGEAPFDWQVDILLYLLTDIFNAYNEAT
jgi:hypothetical protein